jgi:hypothetical protein
MYVFVYLLTVFEIEPRASHTLFKHSYNTFRRVFNITIMKLKVQSSLLSWAHVVSYRNCYVLVDRENQVALSISIKFPIVLW